MARLLGVPVAAPSHHARLLGRLPVEPTSRPAQRDGPHPSPTQRSGPGPVHVGSTRVTQRRDALPRLPAGDLRPRGQRARQPSRESSYLIRKLRLKYICKVAFKINQRIVCFFIIILLI